MGGASTWAIASKVEFLYIAHFPVHSDVTLDEMGRYLARYEGSKKVFIRLGVRRGSKKGSVIPHFRIPKEHNHHHFIDNIIDLGPLGGTSMEVVEHSHIDNAKIPYSLSNKKNFFPQLKDYVSRRDALNLFEDYLDYRHRYPPASSSPSSAMSLADIYPLQRIQLLYNHSRRHVIAPVLAKRPHRMAHIGDIGPAVPDLSELISSLYRYFVHEGQTIGNIVGRSRVQFELHHLPIVYQILDLWTQYKITHPPLNPYFPSDRMIARCRPASSTRQADYDIVFVRVSDSDRLEMRES